MNNNSSKYIKPSRYIVIFRLGIILQKPAVFLSTKEIIKPKLIRRESLDYVSIKCCGLYLQLIVLSCYK